MLKVLWHVSVLINCFKWWEQNCCVNNDYAMIESLWGFTSNSTQSRHKTQKAHRDKTSFSNESVENADFRKPVLNKIMTSQE